MRHLPCDFGNASAAIYKALPPPLDPNLQDDSFGHFIYALLGGLVENQGLEGDTSRSLDLLEALTMRFPMEFSIRAFLNKHAVETMQRVRSWAPTKTTMCADWHPRARGHVCLGAITLG